MVWLAVAAFGYVRYRFLVEDLPCDPRLCESAEPATDLVVLLVLLLLSAFDALVATRDEVTFLWPTVLLPPSVTHCSTLYFRGGGGGGGVG